MIFLRISNILKITFVAVFSAASLVSAEPGTKLDLGKAESSMLESFAVMAAENRAEAPIPVATALPAATRVFEIEKPALRKSRVSFREKSSEAAEILKPTAIAPAKLPAQTHLPETDVTQKALETAAPKALNANQDQQNSKIEALTKERDTLNAELNVSKTEISALRRDLDDTRSQLSMTETEVRRLSAILRQKHGLSATAESSNSELSRKNSQQSKPTQQRKQILPPANFNQAENEVLPPANKNLPLATVSVPVANLRLGPSESAASLTTLPQGSRVVVEIRKGEWLRVFSPSGERAWISASSVVFGDRGAQPLNDSSAARAKGYSSAVEDRAFSNIVGR